MWTAKLTQKTFGFRKNEEIATYVTIRGAKAHELLNRALRVKEFELKSKNFSANGRPCDVMMHCCFVREPSANIGIDMFAGNFGFGIEEHIDLAIKYDPGIGIFGLDIYVVLARPGWRVARKKRKRGKIGARHRISKADAIAWFKQTFNGAVNDYL